MLRLPAFELARPQTVEEAVALVAEHGEAAAVLGGGTDLLPNMKHGLVTPRVVVSLASIPELDALAVAEDGTLVIGATCPLAVLASDERVVAGWPALAQAAGLVASPQLRNSGTLGGNVMLDTRCRWINQTHFWRKSLGFCLKKDGSECHVVAGGSRCVAAASNDSAPALMSLGAVGVFAGPGGRRELPLESLWTTDGIRNKRTDPGELLVEVRVPATADGHRGAYGKLRDRGSIDFPLLGCAVRLELDETGAVGGADVVLVALQARPARLRRCGEQLGGTTPGKADFTAAAAAVAEAARRQARPLANVPGDPDYRHAMVPVLVRRTLEAAGGGGGPVHPL
ncbi:MAG: FAD binding domain-containing protein [Planctomycetota bacterium]|jgi:4-hydroxybenzoyl-CoA reductase subunit beta|nr:FAD binding domain-containing protein [Planctomycetota bacterium]MDP6990465.1 FAD binding domain-containing protein [Planctomycetota bacterium]